MISLKYYAFRESFLHKILPSYQSAKLMFSPLKVNFLLCGILAMGHVTLPVHKFWTKELIKNSPDCRFVNFLFGILFPVAVLDTTLYITSEFPVAARGILSYNIIPLILWFVVLLPVPNGLIRAITLMHILQLIHALSWLDSCLCNNFDSSHSCRLIPSVHNSISINFMYVHDVI